MHNTSANTSGTIAAFAPSFKTLSSLPFSKNLLLHLSTKTQGDFHYDKNASINNFVEGAGNYTVLQLATHAVADKENPGKSKIYFSDDQYLTLDSVYHLKLNADLIIVSACETAIGKELYAEGMKSFARAFTYSGCKSTVSTLWKVDDKATATVVSKFYDYLFEGLQKDEALQKAKLKYLAEATTDDEAHPFYWAAIILTNDVSPVVLKGKLYSKKYLLWIGGGIFLGAGIYYGRRKKM